MLAGRARRRCSLLRGSGIGLALLLDGQRTADDRPGGSVMTGHVAPDAADGSATEATRSEARRRRHERDKNDWFIAGKPPPNSVRVRPMESYVSILPAEAFLSGPLRVDTRRRERPIRPARLGNAAVQAPAVEFQQADGQRRRGVV